MKSKWRPISSVLNGNEFPAICSTLPALRAPQPPTAPPPEDGVVTLISGQPDVTLCGNAAAGHDAGRLGIPANMVSSFRKQAQDLNSQVRLEELMIRVVVMDGYGRTSDAVVIIKTPEKLISILFSHSRLRRMSTRSGWQNFPQLLKRNRDA